MPGRGESIIVNFRTICIYRLVTFYTKGRCPHDRHMKVPHIIYRCYMHRLITTNLAGKVAPVEWGEILPVNKPDQPKLWVNSNHVTDDDTYVCTKKSMDSGKPPLALKLRTRFTVNPGDFCIVFVHSLKLNDMSCSVHG